MKTVTMQFPITLSIEEGTQVTKAYAFNVPGASVEYGSNGTAVKKMKTTVSALVSDAIKFSAREYRQRRILVTNEGTVILVVFENGSFGYFMATKTRDYAGSCWGRPTFEETLMDARKHAESSFGGIAWESSC